MAVDVQIGGGKKWNTKDYSVNEDATPIDVSSTSGGTPQFTLGTNLLEGDKSLIGRGITITDGAQGRTQGKITGLSSQGNTLRISGYTQFTLLNTVVNGAPFSGRLDNALGYLLGLVGFTSSNYQVDSTIAARSVSLIGFSGNLQDQIKALCAGQQVELSFVDGQFVLRPLRQNFAQIYRDSQDEFTMDTSQQAQRLDIFYYNPVAITNKLAYPVSQLDRGDDVQQVSDGQVITVSLRLNPSGGDGSGEGVSVASIVQPAAVDSVDESIAGFSGTQSMYSVVDSNNNPVPAADWTAAGGLVTAVIDPDSNGITLTIRGATAGLGPYRIAGTNDDGNSFYSTMRIVGTGIRYNKKIWSVPTGLTSLDTNTVSPSAIDNFAIGTIGDAMSAGLSALRNFQGPSQQISVTARGINTPGVSGEYTLITFGKWDSLFGGITFSTWDASWGGKTFQVYDDYLFSLVRGQFANQAFGNVGGARVLNDYSMYRISTASLSDSNVTYTADVDNTIQDWDNVWGGKTFSAWDAVWGGKRFLDYTPYLLAPSVPSNVNTQYFMSQTRQDFLHLKGLRYEWLPNDPSFSQANLRPGTLITNLLTNPSMETAGATYVIRTNLCTNPNLETNASGWIQVGTTNARVTTEHHSGTASLSVTTPGSVSAEGVVFSGTASAMAGKAYSCGAWVKAPMGASLYMVMRTIGSASQDSPRTLFTGAGDWQWVEADNNVAQSDATSFQLQVRTQTTQAVTFYVDDAIVEQSFFVGPQFDGSISPDSDLTPAWTGTANASTSTLSAPSVSGVTIPSLSNGLGFQSSQWSKLGSKSLRLTPGTNSASNASYADIYPIPVTAGQTYTAIAVGYLPTMQTGSGATSLFSRSISARFTEGSELIQGPQMVNTVGEQEVRFTFTVPTSRTTLNLRLSQGVNAFGDVYWDSVTLVSGVYTGPAFDGNTPGAVWTGTPNASTSQTYSIL